MISYLKLPKPQLFLLICLVALVTRFKIDLLLTTLLALDFGIFEPLTHTVLFKFLLSILLCALIDTLVSFLVRKKVYPPFSGLVTGAIIGVLIDPSYNFLKILVICVVASLSKYLLRLNNRHLFNPAALGVFLGALVLRSAIPWSVPSQASINQNIVAFLFILCMGYISGFRLKKYLMISTFLLVNLILTGFGSKNYNFVQLLADPTVLFFAFVMLPEPMTSPNTKKLQVVFGMVVALFSALFSYMQTWISVNLPDVFLPSLLLANLIFHKRR